MHQPCLTCTHAVVAEDIRWISPGDVKRLPWAACDVTGRDAVLKFIYAVLILEARVFTVLVTRRLRLAIQS
jgi:hypothetical protein